MVQLAGRLRARQCFPARFVHDILIFKLNREKEKNEVRDSKVLKILESKDVQIQQLERVRQNEPS